MFAKIKALGVALLVGAALIAAIYIAYVLVFAVIVFVVGFLAYQYFKSDKSTKQTDYPDK